MKSIMFVLFMINAFYICLLVRLPIHKILVQLLWLFSQSHRDNETEVSKLVRTTKNSEFKYTKLTLMIDHGRNDRAR